VSERNRRKLLGIELRILGERHHRAGDGDGAARGEIGDERPRLTKRDADAADSRVDADVQRHRMPNAGRHAIELAADGRVHHRHHTARHDLRELGGSERAEQQDRLRDASIAQRHRLVQLDDREARDRVVRLERARDVDHSGAVAVVLNHRENRPAANPAADGRHVLSECRRVDLEPRIERRIADRRRGGCSQRRQTGQDRHRRRGPEERSA